MIRVTFAPAFCSFKHAYRSPFFQPLTFSLSCPLIQDTTSNMYSQHSRTLPHPPSSSSFSSSAATTTSMIDGTWEISVHMDGLDLRRIRVRGDLHVGGLMLKIVEGVGGFLPFVSFALMLEIYHRRHHHHHDLDLLLHHHHYHHNLHHHHHSRFVIIVLRYSCSKTKEDNLAIGCSVMNPIH